MICGMLYIVRAMKGGHIEGVVIMRVAEVIGLVVSFKASTQM